MDRNVILNMRGEIICCLHTDLCSLQLLKRRQHIPIPLVNFHISVPFWFDFCSEVRYF